MLRVNGKGTGLPARQHFCSFKLTSVGTFTQDGDIDKHSSPPPTTTLKLQLKYRTTFTQTVRNQVEWKSDNYRIKETTSVHTGRGAEMWKGLVPHPHVVDENSGGISQE